MKIPFHFSEQLHQARTKAKLSKTAVSRATGIDIRRIQEYETNRRVPTPLAQKSLARFFNLKLRIQDSPMRRFSLVGLMSKRGIHRRQPKRPFRVRLTAARRKLPILTSRLERKICQRPDLTQILDVLVELSLDSYLEIVFILKLLADDATLGFVSIGSRGYPGPKIVDPTNRQNIGALRLPAIKWGRALWFPQVSLLADCLARVDFLVCRESDSGPTWLVVELDGEGHRPDHSREMLPFKTVRLTESEVKSNGLLSTLKGRIGDHQRIHRAR